MTDRNLSKGTKFNSQIQQYSNDTNQHMEDV